MKMFTRATSRILLLKAFASFFIVTSAHHAHHAHPKFTVPYILEGEIKYPYAEIVEPFKALLKLNRSRVDYYNGMTKTEHLVNDGDLGSIKFVFFKSINSKLNVPTCLYRHGPHHKHVKIQKVLPNPRGFRFQEKKLCPDTFEEHKGKDCEIWSKNTVHGFKKSSNLLWVRSSGHLHIPVRHELRGSDITIVDYKNYKSGDFDDEELDIATKETPCHDRREYADSYFHDPMSDLVENDQSHIDAAFEEFKGKHKKSYPSDVEHNRRKVNFKNNFRYIHSVNRMGLTYTLGVNHMTDWSPEELKSVNGLKPDYDESAPSIQDESSDVGEIPETMNWRLLGAVTPVKDQIDCGSCWSFGTTGTIEGSYFLKTGNLIRLSEQQLLDCSWGQGNGGCNGGSQIWAYKYIMKNGGLEADESYGRYLGADGKCHHNASLSVVKVKSFRHIQRFNATALLQAVYFHGPITVNIDSSQLSFYFYANGIYENPHCKKKQLDHSVLVVGYGKIDQEPYWLVKNSWSTYWGDDGYILISRKNNTCGVTTHPTYAILE